MAASSSGPGASMAPGDIVGGKFVINAHVGKGSFATVYRATNKDTKEAVAIKSVAHTELAAKLKSNLQAEISILQRLRHPHIVALHSCYETTRYIHLVMEYCELGDLSLLIKKREKLATHPATAEMTRKYPPTPNGGFHEVLSRHFLKQLASAIHFLRSENLVHRDVKPQNMLLLPSRAFREAHQSVRPILITDENSTIPDAGLPSLPMLKLADFGFARSLPSASMTDTLCGSPLYMAPEILRTEKYDAKADLWSIGTVLHEMVTGRPPYRASNHLDLLKKIEMAIEPVRFPSGVTATPELKDLIRGLLKRNPVERIGFDDFFNHPVVVNPIQGVAPEDAVPQRTVLRRTHTLTTAGAGASVDTATKPAINAIANTKNAPRPGPAVVPAPATAQRMSAGNGEPLAPPVRALPIGRRYTGHSLMNLIAHKTGLSPPSLPSPLGARASGKSAHPDRQAYDGLDREEFGELPVQPESSKRGAVSETRRDPAATTSSRRPTSKHMADHVHTREAFLDTDYVVIDKGQVEVNVIADKIAAAARATKARRSSEIARRKAAESPPLTAVKHAVVAQRPPSQENQLAASPTSTLNKVIHEAKIRVLGMKNPSFLDPRTGTSPPNALNSLPAYFDLVAVAPALIGDGKSSLAGPGENDEVVLRHIEDLANRANVVHNFAEIKLKQLLPITPSMDHGLDGTPADEMDDSDALTTEAVVTVSQEAIVLYYKCLMLLHKVITIAYRWWERNDRPDLNSTPRQTHTQARISSTAQWTRGRFNQVLEKIELSKQKLLHARKTLSRENPAFDREYGAAAVEPDDVFITPGTTAARLMFVRAVEMSGDAATREAEAPNIQCLEDCARMYSTAVSLMEAILEPEDSMFVQGERASPNRTGEVDGVKRSDVINMLGKINSRLAAVRTKLDASDSGSSLGRRSPGQELIVHRRSGDFSNSNSSAG